jgi:hypothetical protein
MSRPDPFPPRTHAFTRASTACRSTLAPSAQASDEAYSISAWLIPSIHGTKIIAVGTTRATYAQALLDWLR